MPQPHQHRIPVSSVTYTTVHDNARSLTQWARPRIKTATSWLLVGFISAVPQRELPHLFFFFFFFNVDFNTSTLWSVVQPKPSDSMRILLVVNCPRVVPWFGRQAGDVDLCGFSCAREFHSLRILMMNLSCSISPPPLTIEQYLVVFIIYCHVTNYPWNLVP